MFKRFICSLMTTLAVVAAANVATAEDWGVTERPAVVNPVVRSQYADVVDLSGEWDFTNDQAVLFRLGVGDGVWGSANYSASFNNKAVRKITVPGLWEAQGVGETKPGNPWDPFWDKGEWTIRNEYLGFALYRKKAAIPENWDQKRVWLKIGGVSAQAYIWVNGKRAAFLDVYAGARKFDVTDFVVPGEEADIVALVRNDVPSRLGLYRVAAKAGGFYRNVELEATPDVYVDDVWARGDVESLSADVRVYVKSTDLRGEAVPNYDDELSPAQREELAKFNAYLPKPNTDKQYLVDGFASVDVTIKTLDGDVVGQAKRASNATKLSENGLPLPFRFNIPIKNCKLWTPETPNLYLAEVVLRDADGEPIHGWTERFGVRELKAVGKQFFLNGKPYFFRGGGDHNYDQLQLFELGDREQFREHMTIYREAGFNYLRFHTHCPFPEYFECADEFGILLQPELPYYHDVPCEGFEFNPKREMFESFRANRRYVSFATYSWGNEGFLGEPLDVEMYDWVQKYDPDRLVVHQDGGVNNRPTVNSDYQTNGAGGTMIINPWTPGAHDSVEHPFVAHEYLNLAIKMDPRLEPKFTGVRVAPVSVASWLEKLESLGLNEDWGAGCIAASEKLQGVYQKRGIESARLDASCDGYLFWSLVDASIPQGSCVAAQGYLDSFWQPRPNGVQPKDFYRFNGPSVILAETDLAAPILAPGMKFRVNVKLSHYDADPIPASDVLWKFAAEDGTVLAQGEIPTNEIPAGFAGPLKSFDVTVPDGVFSEPRKLGFSLAIAGTDIYNSWDYWFFPPRRVPSLEGFVVSDYWFDAFSKLYDKVARVPDDPKDVDEDVVWIVNPGEPAFANAIEAGRKVVAITPAAAAPNVSLGWWSIGTQIGAAVAKSKAFEGFPTSDCMDELWFRLVRVGAPDLAAKPLGDAYEPLFVGEGRDSYYLYLGQTKFGDAKVLASYALDLTQDSPEANALLDALLRYVYSDDFDPQKETSALHVKKLVKPDDAAWGISKLLSQPTEQLPWHTLYEDNVLYPFCRQREEGSELSWLTGTRDCDAETTTFVFVGALGYWSEPKTDGFLMTIDDKTQIRFDLPESGSLKVGDVVEWKSEDGKATLSFELGRASTPGPDYFGVFRLVVPAAELNQDAQVSKIVVKSLGKGSSRWFAVHEYYGLLVDAELAKEAKE